MEGGKFEEAVVFMNCSKCDREMRKIASDIMTKKEWQTSTWKKQEHECQCCLDDYHDVVWEYETAEDNMCGDGCMIQGTCSVCGASGVGEFSNRNVDFEVQN